MLVAVVVGGGGGGFDDAEHPFVLIVQVPGLQARLP